MLLLRYSQVSGEHVHLPGSPGPEDCEFVVEKRRELVIDVCASFLNHVKGPTISTWYSRCQTCLCFACQNEDRHPTVR